jgi:hypothetical protein
MPMSGAKGGRKLVCGDINDGPGMDACEKWLFGNVVERFMVSVWKPALCLFR